MKCPHCERESKAKVLESRKIDGEAWRLRLCTKCLKQFVSREMTSKDMKFPWTALDRQRRRQKSVEEAPVQKQNKWVFPTKLW